MKMAEMTKPLKFCARDENGFSSEEMIFDNLNWIETKKICRMFICALQSNETFRWLETVPAFVHCKENTVQRYFQCAHVDH